MAWVAVNNNFSSDIFILYLAAIFWTLGYDTIYGAQDIADDEIIGVKSTSIKFKNRMKFFVSICYILSSSFIIYLFYSYIGFNYFTMLLSIFILTLIFQIFFFKKDVPETCLKAFKLNNFSGLILFLGIVLIN
jgi:4-hydroxybenzoate polyprenyltransferase